jgi:hypothetical protein
MILTVLHCNPSFDFQCSTKLCGGAFNGEITNINYDAGSNQAPGTKYSAVVWRLYVASDVIQVGTDETWNSRSGLKTGRGDLVPDIVRCSPRAGGENFIGRRFTNFKQARKATRTISTVDTSS